MQNVDYFYRNRGLDTEFLVDLSIYCLNFYVFQVPFSENEREMELLKFAKQMKFLRLRGKICQNLPKNRPFRSLFLYINTHQDLSGRQ